MTATETAALEQREMACEAVFPAAVNWKSGGRVGNGSTNAAAGIGQCARVCACVSGWVGLGWGCLSVCLSVSPSRARWIFSTMHHVFSVDRQRLVSLSFLLSMKSCVARLLLAAAGRLRELLVFRLQCYLPPFPKPGCSLSLCRPAGRHAFLHQAAAGRASSSPANRTFGACCTSSSQP